MRLSKKYQYLSFFFMLVLLMNCTKDKKEESKIHDQEYTISAGIEKQTYSRSLNYDSLLTVVDQLSEMVAVYPSDTELKKKLVSICYDTLTGTIIASGRGKPLINARSPALAHQYAQRAAMIEALRLAAKIKKWQSDPKITELGTITSEMPFGRMVSKKELSDGSLQVLVEIKAADITL